MTAFKVFALVGSPRVGNTHRLCQMIVEKLAKLVEVEASIKRVEDYNIQYCRGCSTCLVKGVECPIGDGFKELKSDIAECDLFILASPVYVVNVSAQLKTVLDRACSWYHRPPFLGKPAIVAATTASHGLRQVFNVLRTAVVGWGMVCIGEVGAKFHGDRLVEEEKTARKIGEVAGQAARVLERKVKLSPSAIDLVIFESMKREAKESLRWAPHDYRYWEEHGLFEKPYYSDGVHISPFTRALAKLLLAATAPMYR